MKKQRCEESEKRREETRRDEKRREEEGRSEKRKSQKTEDPGARKGRKITKHFFLMICGSGGSKSRLAKAAGGAIWPDERWKTARDCGAKHVSKSKCTKHVSSETLLGIEMSKKCTQLWREAHSEVKMYKTPKLRTTYKLRCRKSARCCGPKHISKSKC